MCLNKSSQWPVLSLWAGILQDEILIWRKTNYGHKWKKWCTGTEFRICTYEEHNGMRRICHHCWKHACTCSKYHKLLNSWLRVLCFKIKVKQNVRAGILKNMYWLEVHIERDDKMGSDPSLMLWLLEVAKLIVSFLDVFSRSFCILAQRWALLLALLPDVSLII